MSQLTREEIEMKYRDIIHAERPQNEAILRKHPKMSHYDRAKIFAPFAALRGHGNLLLNEENKLRRQRKIEMTDGQASILSDKLSQVEKGMAVGIVYFQLDADELGYYLTIDGKVTEFDPVFRKLKIEKTTIPFDDILDVFGEGIENIEWSIEQERDFGFDD